MKLSTKGRYGLRAMIDLAEFSEAEPVSIASISQRQGISERYLEQLMAKLKKAELITESRRKNFIDYQLNTSVFEEILLWFQQFSKEEEK